MAVKVFCGICEKFIKNVEEFELQRLTGKETCEECGDKVRELYQVFDKLIEDCKAEVEKSLAQTKKKFSTLDATYDRFCANIQSIRTTTRAEIDSQLQNVLTDKK